ncbi:hypothetical protein BDP55DRAFT_736674 [Colletotrichum godetiae]|uniref:Uncharacterized protein n=1 Tax=Colletotrichum godetiae TaxID=1209918 RepID=A0AAJ0F0Q9_9PEZI|nr:uncharacterized protein BDP55DRAFT_736674 [Colletotrichum godetiae]KAK1701475.1 hypothetical protein BDP55DRAFT_736674 [Colletotrichum godetiae]
MFNTLRLVATRLSSPPTSGRMVLTALKAQPRTARTIEPHNRYLINVTKTLTGPDSSAQDSLGSSFSDNQSRYGSPHQDNPFRGFIRDSRKTKMGYKYESPRRNAGQQVTSPTSFKSYLASLRNFRSLFTQVVEVLDNPREYAINQWTDREEGFDGLPQGQDEILRRLRAVERRQELHTNMVYCVMSGFVLGTALLIIAAVAASEIGDKGNSKREPAGKDGKAHY